jgi:hypothetical protein
MSNGLSPHELAARRQVCKNCQHYRGTCLLGHTIQSTFGCPLRKFAPVDSAPYLALKPELIKVVTWPEILSRFNESMTRWVASGLPLAPEPVHKARFAKCRTCEEYLRFQCKLCHCVAYLKAKLETESCPKNLWPKSELRQQSLPVRPCC